MMDLVKKRAKRLIQLLGLPLRGNRKEWKDIEYFDDSWINRMHMMAHFLPNNVSVMDLGCGDMRLKEIRPISEYIPVDYCDRGPGTQLCDFNKKEFPNKVVDYSFVSGCLEYIDDPKWFISEIAKTSNACIISYCTTNNISDIKTRRHFCWVNDLSRADIIELFKGVHMHLKNEALYLSANNIFVFSKEGDS